MGIRYKPKRIYTARDLFDEAQQQRTLPVSEYAASFLETVARMRGITPQQALDEIIAYHHVKGEIETEIKRLMDEFSQIDFSQLNSEAVKTLFMILSLTERHSVLQSLISLRLMNLTQMVQPVYVYQQATPTPVYYPPPMAEIPSETGGETGSGRLLPPELTKRLEESILSGFQKYIDRVCEKLASPSESRSLKQAMMEEMIPMMRQMVQTIQSVMTASLTPKQQQTQIPERKLTEEERKQLLGEE